METKSKTRAIKAKAKSDTEVSPTKLSNRGKRWTDPDRSKMFEELEKGESFKKIGELLGRSERAIELEFAKHVQERQKEGLTDEALSSYFCVDEEVISKALKSKLTYDKSEKSGSSNGSKKIDQIQVSETLIKVMEKLNESNEKVIKLLEENTILKQRMIELEKELSELLKKR